MGQLHCRTSAEWIDHFRVNWQRHRSIPWDESVSLTPAEHAAVRCSIQIFQLGESGEGRHFCRVAKRYADRVSDPDYPAAVTMFLHEEHRHAYELGLVLDLLKAPRLRKDWSDRCFRWLRHCAGLGLMICVLLTGEVMGRFIMPHFAALQIRGYCGDFAMRF